MEKKPATSNIQVNVTVNVDKETLTDVLVEVLRDGQVIKNLGEDGLKALAKILS